MFHSWSGNLSFSALWQHSLLWVVFGGIQRVFACCLRWAVMDCGHRLLGCAWCPSAVVAILVIFNCFLHECYPHTSNATRERWRKVELLGLRKHHRSKGCCSRTWSVRRFWEPAVEVLRCSALSLLGDAPAVWRLCAAMSCVTGSRAWLFGQPSEEARAFSISDSR